MKHTKGNIPILLGLLLIVAAFCLTGYNLHDEQRAAQSARQACSQLARLIPRKEPTEPQMPAVEEATVPAAAEPPDYVLNPAMEMPEKEIDGVAYIGLLQIPALELELPVISRWSYDNFKLAPCRYRGSAYQGSLILAGHNYPCFFGRLKNLSQGDAVRFTDMDGNVFDYEVVALETMPPTATEEMESGEYDLTLFTCTVGAANRIAVRCDRVSDSG